MKDVRKQRRAVVVGFDYYANFLAQLVNEQNAGWTLIPFKSNRTGTMRALAEMRRADAVISFGGPGPNAALAAAARRRNVPVIVIWAGSDVMKAAELPSDLHVIKEDGYVHLSDGPWLVDELRELGLEAEYLPVTAVTPGDPPKPLPAKFSVLTYLPEPRREFYGEALVYRVARAMPDVPFTVVGNGTANRAAPPNVRFEGYVGDMARRLDEATVLLRQPEHDGKSMLVLEALSRARHVIWNYPFPYVHRAEGFEKVYAALCDLRRGHAEGTLAPNLPGRAFALEEFARPVLAQRFCKRLDAAAEAAERRAQRPPKRVALTGLGLFCAQVAAEVPRVAPDWEPRILRTNSRLEVLTAICTLASCDLWYSIGSPLTDRFLHLAARLLRKPRVVHWVGSDIAALAHSPAMRARLQSSNVMHLTEVSWTANQLERLGLRSSIAPLPPRQVRGGAVPLPERFTLMLYVPRTRSEFYGRRSFERLMHRLRHLPMRYFIVGGGTLEVPEGVDAQNLGWRASMEDAYAETTLLIRNTPRDGLSLMVLEALSFGRHVIWTQEFPHVLRANTYADIEHHVLTLYEQHCRGELKPQFDAVECVRESYGSDVCIRRIAQSWEAARTHHPLERLTS